ncbi:MAG: putative glycoside hydrolase [Spirochaetia bacterium]
MLLLFAGGMLFLLGAQERNPEEMAVLSEIGQADTLPLLNPGYSTPGKFTIEQILETPSGILYATSKQRGFLISFDDGASWLERNNGLPRRVVYPFSEESGRIRHLTAVNIDPNNEGRVAVTTADQLYLSENYGGSWQQIPIGKPLRSTSYLTSVALSPRDPDTLLVGTSFNGFFETTDRGASWQDPSLSARFLYRGAGFYEEISGLSYHPADSGVIFFACGFGHGVYRGSPDRKTWTRLEFPGDDRAEVIHRLEILPAGASWTLQVQTHKSRWLYPLATGNWRLAGSQDLTADPVPDPFRRERIRKASDRFGIYVSSYRAQGEDLDNHLQFIKDNGLNSLVVDCKDDFGWIAYDTNLEFPKEIGAVNKRFSLEELVDKAHRQDIYVIARLVVFKDQRLYRYNDFEYAVWNGVSGQPWRYLVKVEVPPEPEEEEEDAESPEDGEEEEEEEVPPEPVYKYVQNEYWVDPYNPDVWSYNLAIAEELQERGVDEIQFDYIRFPSDGRLSQIQYRYRREGMTPIDALESFLTQARESIHIPISTDLYGFNSWHRMGNWIGQSIDVLADYVDAICPMFYPSHFPRDFMKDDPYLERGRKIYQEGTSRAAFMVGKRSIIRPYVQAFLIGAELAMGPAEYSLYLTNQIEGTLAAPSSGFTLWNASNRYYMVTEPLTSYIPGTPSE